MPYCYLPYWNGYPTAGFVIDHTNDGTRTDYDTTPPRSTIVDRLHGRPRERTRYTRTHARKTLQRRLLRRIMRRLVLAAVIDAFWVNITCTYKLNTSDKCNKNVRVVKLQQIFSFKLSISLFKNLRWSEVFFCFYYLTRNKAI